MNKKIATSVGIAIIGILAVIIAMVFWAYQELQVPIQSVQNSRVSPFQSQAGNQNVTSSTTQPQAVQPSDTQTIDLRSKPLVSPDAKVAIHFTLKDGNGNLLKGIQCDVTTNSENNTKMVTIASKKSGADGQCFFENLDPKNPYLVRVYWTKDHSVDAMISLSWITPGTTASRIIIKP